MKTTRRLPCGTPAAYDFHRRHGETPCEACRKARSAKAKEQRDAKRRPAPPPDFTVASDVVHLRVSRRDGSEHVILFDYLDGETVLAHKWAIIPSVVPDLLYAATNIKIEPGRWRMLSLHTLLMGEPGADHINHNGLDNRRANLRPATRSQQGANQRPMSGGTSQYKGVSWKTSQGMWVARIGIGNHRMRHLGYFASEEAAARAYDAAALNLWGEYAYPNFPGAP